MSKEKEDFMTSKWRPMMAVTYMAINICDFILFPILFTVVQFWETQAANDAFRQWQPMTLQGGGLIHMAFGAILGVAAWTRGQEKVAQVQADNTSPKPDAPAPTPVAPEPTQSATPPTPPVVDAAPEAPVSRPVPKRKVM